MYAKNPIKAFNDVVTEGINEKGPNLYIKGDVNIGATMEKLFESKDMQELLGVAQPLSRESFPSSQQAEDYSTYEEYLKSHQENISNVFTETLRPVFEGLRNLGI
jgi:hypothetical protein